MRFLLRFARALSTLKPMPPQAFDTYALVRNLESVGFTREQAEVVIEVLQSTNHEFIRVSEEKYATKLELTDRMLAYKAVRGIVASSSCRISQP
jgi:hypothetical protein